MLDVIEAIRGRIEEYEAQLSEYLLNGNSHTHEDYMKQVGKAHAFKLIKQDLEEIEQRYIED
jgi:phage shock protein A